MEHYLRLRKVRMC